MSAIRLRDRRALCTPSRTSTWLVCESRLIWMAASTTATSSGPAINASPSSMSPVRDFGRGQRIGLLLSIYLDQSTLIYLPWPVPWLSRLPGITLQAPLPVERGAHDGVQLVVLRRPLEQLAHAVALGDQAGRVARAARLFADVEFGAGDALHAVEYLAHAVAMPVTHVGRERIAAGPQVIQGVEMRAGEIGDVNVVAYAGAVRGRVVRAEHRQLTALADRVFGRHLDEQRGLGRGLADAALGVRTRDVEVAQHHVPQGGGGAEVAQHPFGHQLGRAVGIDGLRGRVLGGQAGRRHAIDSGGGREHEVLDPGPRSAFQQ